MTNHYNQAYNSLILTGVGVEFTKRSTSIPGELFSFRLGQYDANPRAIGAFGDVIEDLGTPSFVFGVPCPPYWHSSIEDASQVAINRIWIDLKNNLDTTRAELVL